MGEVYASCEVKLVEILIYILPLHIPALFYNDEMMNKLSEIHFEKDLDPRIQKSKTAWKMPLSLQILEVLCLLFCACASAHPSHAGIGD